MLSGRARLETRRATEKGIAAAVAAGADADVQTAAATVAITCQKAHAPLLHLCWRCRHEKKKHRECIGTIHDDCEQPKSRMEWTCANIHNNFIVQMKEEH